MTIYELDDILALKNWDRICAEIEKRGFRRAGEVGEWEFDPLAINEESAYRQSAIQVDEPTDTEYRGTLARDNRVYKGLTFIVLTRFLIVRDRGNASIPRRALLFVGASRDPNM